MNRYNKLNPFKAMCLRNFPFIEQTIDSTTEYQLYSELVAYVNSLIDQINVNTKDVQDFIVKFNDLQKHVDDYFTNLDVQTEINTKLDQMVTDGVFDTIINDKIFKELNTKVDTNTQSIEAINTNNETYVEPALLRMTQCYDTFSDTIVSQYDPVHSKNPDDEYTVLNVVRRIITIQGDEFAALPKGVDTEIVADLGNVFEVYSITGTIERSDTTSESGRVYYPLDQPYTEEQYKHILYVKYNNKTGKRSIRGTIGTGFINPQDSLSIIILLSFYQE